MKGPGNSKTYQKVSNLASEKQVLCSRLRPFQRLDLFISNKYSDRFSRTKIQKLIKEGNIMVNDKIVTKPSFQSKEETVLRVTLPKECEEFIFPKDLAIPILYEDKHLAVIHKPPKTTVHPGAGSHQDTLVHSLLAQFKHLSNTNSPQRPGIVHRLDRDTEGLMLIAKNNHAHYHLAKQFKSRNIYKEYHAWFLGVPKADKSDLEGYVGRHPKHRKLMQFKSENSSIRDKYANLSYQLVKKIKNYSLLQIIPKTGRTHQIRCSFAFINMYIPFDVLYGHNSFKQSRDYDRFGLLLVANKLKFVHPISQKSLEFSIKLPKRFLTFEKEIPE